MNKNRARKSYIVWILVGIFLMSLFFSSCTKADSSVKVFNDYKSKWQKQDYKAMYGMLSKEAKSTITEKQFVDRYTAIYKGTEAKGITIKIKNEDSIKDGKNVTMKIPFSLGMDTVAGTIKISNYEAVMVKETVDGKKQWKLAWNEKMIFPNLDKEDKVRVNINAAKRGELYDRNGKGLAINGTIISLGIHPSRFAANKDANIAALSKILDIDSAVIENKLKNNTNPEQFVPIVSIASTEKDKITAALKIDGVIQYKIQGRIYPGGEAFGSLIGYIAPITAEELGKMSGQGYSSSSLIGKAGLEQVYEKRLKGENGAEIYISKQKDGKEEKISIAKKESKDGENIKLSIDFDLQNKIYLAMNKDAGASTAINPKNGQVLAMVSSPSYDSNLFTTYISNSQNAAWKSSTKDPFQNRFKAAYAPGSTFKIVTAAIGLNDGKINTTDSVNIQGTKWQADKSWGSYMVTRVTDPGKPVNLQDAFVYSDNIYFAKAALNIGKSDFMKGCSNFGIGEALPFDYPIAKSQITNGTDLKNDVALADSGYGQGEVLMSPLHMALIYSSLVNDGNIMIPSLEASNESSAKVWKEKLINADNIKILTDNLTAVIENPQGTGHLAKIDGIPLAGKTGTAELKKNNDDKNAIENGWFICMNTNDPKLVVSMIIEDVRTRGESHYVVPIVKNIMEYYLKK